MEREDERLINCKQAQYLLSCGRSYLDGLCKKGKLRPVMDSNRKKFYLSDIKRYQQSLRQKEDKELKKPHITFLNCILK